MTSSEEAARQEKLEAVMDAELERLLTPEGRRRLADAAVRTWTPSSGPVSVETEAQLRSDMSLYGVAFVVDGERVDPRTVVPASEDDSDDA